MQAAGASQLYQAEHNGIWQEYAIQAVHRHVNVVTDCLTAAAVTVAGFFTTTALLPMMCSNRSRSLRLVITS